VYLLEEYEISFHASFATGSRTVGKVITEHLGGKRVGSSHNEYPVPAGYRSFTIIRPPWEVCASQAGSIRKSVAEWLEAHPFTDSSNFARKGPLGIEASFRRRWCQKVILFDKLTLQEDVEKCLVGFGVPLDRFPKKWPHIQNPRPPLALSRDDLKLVHALFRGEILHLWSGSHLCKDFNWSE
jgi:hypothetical protein